MKKNTLWIVAGLLALLLIGVWSWRVQSDSPVAPALSSEVPQPAPPPAPAVELTETPVSSDATPDRVPISNAPAAPAAKPAEFGLIRVLVLDKETGKPLRGAKVTARHEITERSRRVEVVDGTRGKAFESIETGEDGRVEIEMPLMIESKVSAGGLINAGYEQVIVPPLTADGAFEVVFRLPTANDLPFWLKLVEEETRAPIRSAKIRVTRDGGASRDLVTDAGGLVFYAGRTWMDSMLAIESERHATLSLQAVPGHATAETALVVALPLAATVRIVVTDPAGAVVPDAEVKLETANYNLRLNQNLGLVSVSWTSLDARNASWSARTDTAGVAVIAQVPVRVPIRASLTAPKAWQPAEPFVFEPGETRTITWALSAGCTLRGVLLDSGGRPVAQRAMLLYPAFHQGSTLFTARMPEPGRSTKTDDEGRFRFDETAPGDWLVGPTAREAAQADENDVAPLGQFVRVPEGQSEVDVTIRVDRGLFIRGRLLSSDGQSPSGGFVQAADPVRNLHSTDSADRKDGTFVIGPLMAGRYQVFGMGMPDGKSDRIDVDAGTDGVEIRLKVGAKLAGRVVGANGEALDGRINCSPHGQSPTLSMGTGVRKGAFELRGLDAGAYDLAVIAADGSIGVLENVAVQAGETRTGLSISVAPGGSVRVRHEGPDRVISVAILQRGIMIASDGIERDAARTFGAPAGTVAVRVTYREDPRTVERVVQVKAGETVEVTFEKGAR